MMARQCKPRRSRSEWQQIVADQQQSGLSIKAYCDQNEITESSFHLWKKKLSDHPITESDDTNHNNWLSLDIPATTPDVKPWDIELDLPGGVTLRMRTS
jgi:transposase-like protein